MSKRKKGNKERSASKKNKTEGLFSLSNLSSRRLKDLQNSDKGKELLPVRDNLEAISCLLNSILLIGAEEKHSFLIKLQSLSETAREHLEALKLSEGIKDPVVEEQQEKQPSRNTTNNSSLPPTVETRQETIVVEADLVFDFDQVNFSPSQKF